MKLDLMHNCFILSSCDLLDMFLFLFGCFVRICHHGCKHLIWPSDVEDCGRDRSNTNASSADTPNLQVLLVYALFFALDIWPLLFF